MSDFRPESHVAQQSRRDKLRFQQQQIEEYNSNLEDQLSGQNGLNGNQDLIHLRNFRYGNNVVAASAYEPVVFSSEMINFVINPRVPIAHHHHQESSANANNSNNKLVGAMEEACFGNLSHHPISSSLNSNVKVSGDPQNCSTWKSFGSDWMVNYSSGSAASTETTHNPIVVGEGLSASLKINNNNNNISSSSSLYMKPSNNFVSYHDVQSSFTNPSSEISTLNNLHSNSSPPVYTNTLQEVVTSANVGTRGNEQLLLASTFDDQSNPTQGLSLSLSSASHPETYTHVGQYIHDIPDSSKASKSDRLCTNSKPLVGIKVHGNMQQENVNVSSALVHRNTGPLGPFTGYATILKSSKFLTPAQQLLDEFCNVSYPKSSRISEKISDLVRASISAANDSAHLAGTNNHGDSGASSSTFYSSNELSCEAGARSCSTESYWPGYQQKKAKLLYMQEEVCRRYKQYHQQMQMVVSSFETVAGLNAATPYISLALKTVSRHFKCLKSAITEQLNHIGKALADDMLSTPNAGVSASKVDTNVSKFKFFEQGLPKQKAGGSNLGFYESQQHVWRPQRGLPERAVAVLRAWLFDHFLHPYPTDTDKHMLATQTGLSRNQVSNWFINARVRVWKPMVEEIHSLETQVIAEKNSNNGEGKSHDEKPPPTDRVATARPNYPGILIGSSSGQEEEEGEGLNVDAWSRDKRSRMESCHVPAGSMDGSLMGFMPYQRSGLEIGGGGLGTVSLTLGLRQSADSAHHQQQQHLHHHQQQQQQQQQEHLLRHFGGGQMMIHDFVG